MSGRNKSGHRSETKTRKYMIAKLKPFLITAVVAIIAVGLFNRFAPASVKSAING